MHSRYPPKTPGIKNSWWITKSCSTPSFQLFSWSDVFLKIAPCIGYWWLFNCWVDQMYLKLDAWGKIVSFSNWMSRAFQWNLKPLCLLISYCTPLDHCLKLRYDAINKMIGMLAEEITVNKGRAAYAGKVKACSKTKVIWCSHTP